MGIKKLPIIKISCLSFILITHKGPDVSLLSEVGSEEEKLEENDDLPQEPIGTQEGSLVDASGPSTEVEVDVKTSQGNSSNE